MVTFYLVTGFKKSMDGGIPHPLGRKLFDEAPMAYKSLSDILDVIGDTVEIIDVMKPVYNFKAAEWHVFFQNDIVYIF